MNKTIQLAILALMLSAPAAFAADEHQQAQKPAAEYKYKTPKLNRAQFDALLVKPEQLTIIDVRRRTN